MPRSSGKQRGSGDDADQVGLRSLLALGDLELDALVLLEAAIAVRLDRAVVHEDVRAVVGLDEAVALFAVEPLDDALRHDALLLAGVLVAAESSATTRSCGGVSAKRVEPTG